MPGRPAHTTDHRRRRSLLAAALICSTLPLGAGAVPASASPVPLAPSGSGLTVPSGIARAADGTLWVADHERGVCRMGQYPSPRPIDDFYCGENHGGPEKPEALAYDAASHSLYVADGVSNAGAVWRLALDPDTGTVFGAVPIARAAGDSVMALALVPAPGGGAPDLVYSTKRSAAIMRISNPSTEPGAPERVGSAADAASAELAYLDGRLYIADDNGVGRLSLDGDVDRNATLVPGLPAFASALVADPANHRLYVGTTNGTLVDGVEVLDTRTGMTELYDRTFAGVTALGVDANGDVLVADDPGDAAGALDTADQGRLFRISWRVLGRPSARIVSGPPGVGSATSVSFKLSASTGAALECRLDDAAWSSCDAAADGTVAYADLPDGVHRFAVRATAGDTAGDAAGRTFVIDTRAPQVTIAPPAGVTDMVRTSRVGLDLLADEPAVGLECTVDGGESHPCDTTYELTGLEPGRHEIVVVGTDAAGNVGEPARWQFEVLPPAPAPGPEKEPAPRPGDHDSDHGSDHDPDDGSKGSDDDSKGSGDDPRVSILERGASPSRAADRPAAGAASAAATPTGTPRPEPRRVSIAAKPGSRSLNVTLSAPARAGHARILLRGDRSTGGRVLVVRHVKVRPGATGRVTLRLTSRERRRLSTGLRGVTVEFSARRGARVTLRAASLWVMR